MKSKHRKFCGVVLASHTIGTNETFPLAIIMVTWMMAVFDITIMTSASGLSSCHGLYVCGAILYIIQHCTTFLWVFQLMQAGGLVCHPHSSGFITSEATVQRVLREIEHMQWLK